MASLPINFDLQPLSGQEKIVDDQGRASGYLLRYLLDRKGFLTEQELALSETLAQLLTMAEAELVPGSGIAIDPLLVFQNPVISLEELSPDPTGTYGDATHVAQITVDIHGRVTEATDVAIAGGGGSAAWTLINNTTIAAPTASLPITGLSAYNELLLVARGLTSSVSGQRNIVVSVDNGATYYTTSGDYVSVSAAGVEANTVTMGIHDTNSAAARTLIAHIQNTKGPVKHCLSEFAAGQRILFVASASDIDAIRLDAILGGAANLTAGTVRLYGR